MSRQEESTKGQSSQTTTDLLTEALPEGIPPEQLTIESQLEIEVDDDSDRGQERKLRADMEIRKETRSLEEHVELQKQKKTDQGAPTQSKDRHEAKTAPTPVVQRAPGGKHEQHVHSNTATAPEPEIKPEEEEPQLEREPQLAKSIRDKRTHEAKPDSAALKQRAEDADHAPKESEDDNVDSQREPLPSYQSAQPRAQAVEEAQVTGLLCTM